MALTKTTQITYREYQKVEAEDNLLYELLNGQLVKKNAPSPQHQRVLQILNRFIDGHVIQKKLGEVFFAPVDVVLNEYNAPHPDLIYISNKNAQLITKDGIMGPPDLVVEIISPSSVVRDRVEKMKLYQQSKIPEYWIIDPAYQSVEIYALKEKEYIVHQHLIIQGKVSSIILPDLKLEIKELFD